MFQRTYMLCCCDLYSLLVVSFLMRTFLKYNELTEHVSMTFVLDKLLGFNIFSRAFEAGYSADS